MIYKKFILLILFFFSSYCYAEEKNLLYLGAGINNFRRPNSRSTSFRAEFKSKYSKWMFHPILGASVTTKKQVYAYGGVSLDLHPNPHFVIAPNFAAGYYNKGDGKDLGFPLEFRSGIEAAIEFSNQFRFGVHISHTSNASIGRKNPGLETIIAFIAIPF
ncbi:MAG: hypothetical protein KR126chlam6_00371 [Candidatus Anoxychlamydiales bacterium]|nr:hypothetical protein [Candidatus Anoxychlamydiales bacterium]